MTDFQLTPRQQRIKELEVELQQLIREEYEATGNNAKAILAECLLMVSKGDRIEAVKKYRDHTGCGLKEAAHALGVKFG